MTDENKPVTVNSEAETKPKWVRSPQGVFETYANQVHLIWSLDDVSLRFAQVDESDESFGPGPNAVTVSVHKAAITIPWRGAKRLHHQLGQLISNYEKVNGEINLKPGIAPNEGT